MMAVLLAVAALLFFDDEARATGWTVVSMKDDWKRIFPDVAP